MIFPESYKDTFTKYLTINFPATKQVRYQSVQDSGDVGRAAT